MILFQKTIFNKSKKLPCELDDFEICHTINIVNTEEHLYFHHPIKAYNIEQLQVFR